MEDKAMNVLSLFDGISCGMLALQDAGIRIDKYYACEIEPSAIEISKSNHPEIIRLGDINNWKQWQLPKIDFIIGGSPCQGFSRNGKGLNFSDPRSVLFFKYVEILEHIRKQNPNVKFLLENVAMKKEWLETIDSFLKVPHREINSRIFSAQNRQRMYWSNIDYIYPLFVDDGEKVNLIDILEKVDTSDFIEHEGILFDPTITEAERSLVSNVNGEIRIRQATKKGYTIAENGDGINLSFPTSKTRRGRVIKQKSPTLDCQCNVCVYVDGVIRHFTRTELERLQTLPEGYTMAADIQKAKKAIGNGWNVKTISHIFRGLNNGR